MSERDDFQFFERAQAGRALLSLARLHRAHPSIAAPPALETSSAFAALGEEYRSGEARAYAAARRRGSES